MLLHIPFKRAHLFILFWVIAMGFGSMQQAQATHIRAGEILARPDSITNNIRRVFFKVVIYYDVGKTSAVNRTATLFFGTGAKQVDVVRTPENGLPTRDPDTWRSVYYFDYTYPASGTYTVTYTEVNRAIGVMNIANSMNQSFLLQTTITIDPFLGINSSPELQVPPIDYGACNQVFVHNPGAYDRDGDVLKFRLVVPLKNAANATPDLPRAEEVSGHRVLNDPSFGCAAVPNGGASTLTMDPNTGQLTWNAPCQAGDYNVAFVIEEYRNGRKIGEVLRDMQIRVKCTPNKKPVLKVPKDTCVVAGDRLIGKISATDPDNDPLLLEAFSGAIKMPPASFTTAGNTGTFTWPTTCTDVQAQPYQVIFKVTDIPKQGFPLTDLQPWNIRVVGPAPQNLTLTPVGRTFRLNWNLYNCQNASKIQIYRHEGPSDFVPETCMTGIPASEGFVKVGEVDKNVVTFTDDGGAAPLKRGVTYCYVIYATFPNPKGGESIATIPVCGMLENSVPVLTNVSVTETSETAGKIQVKWTQPREGLQNMVAPLQYRLFRAENTGDNPAFVQVYQSTNLNDTVFNDTGLNTLNKQYIYRLDFYQSANAGGNPTILVESAPTATSVFLKATPRPTVIDLAWTYAVPWDNTKRKHYIYRKINDGFVLIDSVNAANTTGRYVDKGTYKNIALKERQQYCYYIRTNGTYGNPKLPDPLLNFSQQICATLKDSIPPCPPVLSIDQLNCEAFLQNPTNPPYQNVLTWEPAQSPECTPDIKYFTVYYRPQEEGEFDSIAFTNRDITTYTHSNLPSFAGCYVVTATDSSGNESVYSNTVCKDNCFFFKLPNIFTPNGDNKNDTFRPDPRSRFVKSVKYTVFSRWGDKVYEGTQDPDINWTGVNNAGKPVAEGVYYYLAEVEFMTLSPAESRKTYKGWVEIVR